MITEIVNMDGNTFEIFYQSPLYRGAAIQSLQEHVLQSLGLETLQSQNLLLNSGFETPNPADTTKPDQWSTHQTGSTAVFTYPEAGRVGGSSVAVAYSSAEPGKYGAWQQNLVVTPLTEYTLSGYMMTQNVIGTGAQLNIFWYDVNYGFLGTSVIKQITGTTPWSFYQGTATSPPNAAHASVLLSLTNASGKAYFDDVSLISGTPPVTTYQCINNACTQSTCTPGAAGCFTESTCGGTCIPPPPPPPSTLQNPGFETPDPANASKPDKWITHQTGTSAVFTYPEPGRIGGSSVAVTYISAEAGKYGSWYQTVSATPSTMYSLSGYMMTQNVAGTGAQIVVFWYDAGYAFLSTSVIKQIAGTTPWTYYQGYVTSPATAAYATILLTLNNSSGKAWFDDISWISGTPSTYQCLNNICSPSTCVAGTVGCFTDPTCKGTCTPPPPPPSSTLQNTGFETLDPANASKPDKWSTHQSGTSAVFNYPEPGRVGGKSVSVSYISAESGKYGAWQQTITVNPATMYSYSSYIMTQNVIGTGAQLVIFWYDANYAFLNTSVIKQVSGTTPWTYYQGNITSPTTAAYATILLSLTNSSGKAWFDDVAFVAGAPPTYQCINNVCSQFPCTPGTAGCYTDSSCGGTCTPPQLTYQCINNACTQSSCTPGTSGCFTESTCGNTCTPPPPSVSCQAGQINLLGSCVDQKYILLAGLGFAAIAVLSAGGKTKVKRKKHRG